MPNKDPELRRFTESQVLVVARRPHASDRIRVYRLMYFTRLIAVAPPALRCAIDACGHAIGW
eukprot:689354-Heterocapsa_arctica.AAC.1